MVAGLNILGSLRASFFKQAACKLSWRAACTHPPHTHFQRSFASKASELREAHSLEGQKPKPKAATPLRRTASASLPIRVNPTPTRSDIQPISILTTAERYIFSNLRSRLPSSSILLHNAWWVPKWSAGQRTGEVFLFENGTLVCWGLDETDANKFAKHFVRNSQVELGRLKEPETEDIEFVTDPEQCVY